MTILIHKNIDILLHFYSKNSKISIGDCVCTGTGVCGIITTKYIPEPSLCQCLLLLPACVLGFVSMSRILWSNKQLLNKDGVNNH